MELMSTRQRAMMRAWRAYRDQYKKPLQVRMGQSDENVIVPTARWLIQKSVSFLFGKPVPFVYRVNGIDNQDCTTWLNAIWQKNAKELLLQKIGIIGGVTGHVFVQIIDEEPYPRLVALDTQIVSVETDPRDRERPISYTLTWTDDNTQVGYRQVIEKTGEATWSVADQSQQPRTSTWITDRIVTWPYVWPPIVDCQNLLEPVDYYGIPDTTELILDLIDTLNFVLSCGKRIAKYHASPKTIMKGFEVDELDVSADSTVHIPETGDIKVLELQRGVETLMQLFHTIREQMHIVANIPEIAASKLETIGNLSSLAMEILYEPLIELTHLKRTSYGLLIQTLNSQLADIGNFENVETVIQWPPILPSDPLQERKALALDQTFGVSNETLMQKLGYDPELEHERANLYTLTSMARQDIQQGDYSNGSEDIE
jgi:Phage portal protein, SPP1 Gp6-like